ncbi:dienelactone hydrolase family protein [Chitinophaga agrisoli]|uniref:Dienelactone hydrolase family protein n=1 Tax=Chitinophaga agrisoli TaxID=2607653 RepID=A0A5B2VP57_9BACT|nr:dienelactone hydrolase family protein [Chitinophaga agrisoli]KAA2241493.1 dienelactone hydrolase family protein [Chitinophaga agrisoli]
MKGQTLLFTCLLAAVTGFTACNNQPASQETATDSTATTAAPEVKLKEEAVTYKDDTTTLIGYVVYNEASDQKRPGVLVVPEWWGLNDYTKSRARQLAELGYIALAVDMYGNGKVANTPDEAGKAAGAFYTAPKLIKSRVEAALAQLKTYSQTDTAHVAAIGYCFGGAMVLNAAKLGTPFTGVVSFHGNLAGVPANKDLLKAKILVCHGEEDKFVLPQEVAQFKKSMDSIGADYTFKAYPGATHAFTNPGATAIGKQFNLPIAYNAAADTASWNDMKTFFGKIF